MMNDSNMENTRFISRRGTIAKISTTKKSKKFTVPGVTTLAGDPVLCVIIIEGKERKLYVESGVDIFHPKISEFDNTCSKHDPQLFKDNYGPGKLFPCGPVCKLKGKDIPTMIRYSAKGGIDEDIIIDILKTFDDLKIFDVDRNNGKLPFLLVDGHQS